LKTEKERLITTFSTLGDAMINWGENAEKEEFNSFISEYVDRVNDIIKREKSHNGWFTENSVRSSLYHLGIRLNKEELGFWLSEIELTKNPKKVGIIMAGNLPLVGFHDFLSVVMSGNIAVVKMSSDDNRLLHV